MSTDFNNLLTLVLDTLRSLSFWLQLAVLLIAGLTAALLNQLGQRQLLGGKARGSQTRLKALTYGSGVRLIFPFIMLLLVLPGRAILNQYDFDTRLLGIAVPLLLSLGLVRLAVYLLRKAFPVTPAIKAWENVIATTIWVAVALHLVGWLPAIVEALDNIAITLGSTRLSLYGVGKFVVSLALFIVLALWSSAILERRVRQSQYLSSGFKVGLTKTSRVVLVTIALLFALNATGIDLTALTVFGGALGVGLGFGLQRIASNFVSGFILLFDRSIRPGDVVSIGNSFGWVEALHARYVVVRDRDGVERLIPNENLITSEVINWSYSDRNVRLKIPVQISYGDDPEQAMELMLQTGREHNRVLKDPAPAVRLLEFADNGIKLELRIWLSDPEEGLGSVRSDINLAIWKRFREASITFPFPQRDVHLLGTGSLQQS